jgi:adenylate kinase
MVKQRLQRSDCAQGAILDGFPRNLVQAKAFDALTASDGGVGLAPLINLDDEEAMRRITGRRSCRTCGAVYHLEFNPPKVAGKCDNDGGELYQRDDDKPETVRHRLYVYYKQTSPLIGYYFAKELLVELDGAQSIDIVNQHLMNLIAQITPPARPKA